MIKRITIIGVVFSMICMAFSCGHTHEHSETMKEVIEMNVKIWEDLNSAKASVKEKMKNAVQVTGKLDSVQQAALSDKLEFLVAQRDELNSLDQLIPELEGYEPKCNHEPGEPHSHNTVDINGIPENELLGIHKELRAKLDKVIENSSK